MARTIIRTMQRSSTSRARLASRARPLPVRLAGTGARARRARASTRGGGTTPLPARRARSEHEVRDDRDDGHRRISDIQLAFFAQAVRGITDAANAEGIEVILANTDEDVAKERAAVGVLVDKRVDGLLVVPADPFDTAHLVDAQARGIPVVLLDRVSADSGL